MNRLSIQPDEHWEDLTRAFLHSTDDDSPTAERVAYALRRAFVAERTTVIITEHSTCSSRICGAAECKFLDGPASSMGSEAARTWLEAFEAQWARARAGGRKRAVTPEHIEWWVHSEERSSRVVFVLSWSFANDRVTIYSQLDEAVEAQLARSFDQSVSAMELFANAVRSRHLLECTQKAEELRASFRGRLDTLLHPTVPNTADRLDELVHLLREISLCQDLGTRDDLHCQVLRFANTTLNRLVQHQGAHDQALLADAADSMRRLATNALLAEPARCELSLLAVCVDGLRPDQSAASDLEPCSAGMDVRHQALSLLAVCIRAHRHASKPAAAPCELGAELADFTAHVRATVPRLLVAWVAERARARAASWPRTAESVHNGLRLWLVLDIARMNGELNLKRGDIRETLLALALVSREAIRHRLYSGTPGFEIDATTLTQMLQGIVVVHALRQNESLRDVGLEQLLRSMAVSGFGRWNGDGHQAHVLDVYVMGNFLLDLRVGDAAQPDRDRSKVLSLLAPSGPQAEADLRAAFCLAALFHDAGMLLFPFASHPELSPIEGMRAIADACENVRQQVASVGKSLVEACISDLEVDKHFNPDERWQPWLARQRKHGRPEHELLGAWFLRMTCLKAHSVPRDVSRAAVRATLLHGAFGVKLDVAKDAVAALLVLCDELCDWYPSKPLLDRSEPSRRLNDQTVQCSARQGRARALDLLDLWLQEESGRLVAGIAPPPYAAPTGTGWPTKRVYWPRFEIILRPPSELDVAVLEVWLRCAQNLGRISCAGQRWAPVIKLANAIPNRLNGVQHLTRDLLDELASELDPETVRLNGWLGESELFSSGDHPPTEAVYLVPDAGPASDDHVLVCMDDIVKLATDIVERWETAQHHKA